VHIILLNSFFRTHENWHSRTRITHLPVVYTRKPTSQGTRQRHWKMSADVSTSPPGAKVSVSSRLPVLRKPSSAQALKQTTSGEVVPRGAAHLPSAAPKAPTIVKRATLVRLANGTSGSTTRPGNTIGTTRAAELRRFSAAKSGSLASTSEEGAPGKFLCFIRFEIDF